MRQTASRLNRAWLIVVGLLLMLSGLAGLLISFDLLSPAAQTVAVPVPGPDPSSRIVGEPVTSALSSTWVIVAIGVVGLLLVLFGLGWLAAQIPRRNQAQPFRLHDNPDTGLTRVTAAVLTDAVEAHTKTLPGVSAASAVLRGTAAAPELILKVTATDRTDLPRLLAALQDQVAADLGASLDTTLRRFAVQVEIDATKTGTHHITIPARTLT